MRLKSILTIGIIITLNSSYLQAQNLKRVTKNPYPNFVEQYYVLKDNSNIKEGPYKLTINGVVYQLGAFKNDQRTGIWQIFKSKDVLDFKYNYDTEQLTFLNKDNFMSPGDSTSRGPIYLGGLTYFLHSVANNINTPDELKEKIKSGQYKTIVRFLVDSLGNPKNYEIFSSSKIVVLDLEAIASVRLVSNSNFPFLPALDKGKPITIPMMLPVNFSIIK